MTEPSGITASTGLAGYDLSGIRSLFPTFGAFDPRRKPTPEDLAWRAEHDRRRAELHAALSAAHHALVQVTGVAGAVARLHRPLDDDTCEGCDSEGYESERPAWPCRTAVVLAEAAGVELPERWDQ